MIRIEKHKNTRQWAVWMKDELLAVVCYKKGAAAIKQVLTERLRKTDGPAAGRKQTK
jgi:hypothetical protein